MGRDQFPDQKNSTPANNSSNKLKFGYNLCCRFPCDDGPYGMLNPLHVIEALRTRGSTKWQFDETTQTESWRWPTKNLMHWW